MILLQERVTKKYPLSWTFLALLALAKFAMQIENTIKVAFKLEPYQRLRFAGARCRTYGNGFYTELFQPF